MSWPLCVEELVKIFGGFEWEEVNRMFWDEALAEYREDKNCEKILTFMAKKVNFWGRRDITKHVPNDCPASYLGQIMSPDGKEDWTRLLWLLYRKLDLGRTLPFTTNLLSRLEVHLAVQARSAERSQQVPEAEPTARARARSRSRDPDPRYSPGAQRTQHDPRDGWEVGDWADPDPVTEAPDDFEVYTEARRQNARQVAVQRHRPHGFRPLAECDSADRHALTRFIEGYDALRGYLDALQTVCDVIMPRHMRPAMLRDFRGEVHTLDDLFLEHFSADMVAPFMVREPLVVLVNVRAFAASDAARRLHTLLDKVYGFMMFNALLWHVFENAPGREDAHERVARLRYTARHRVMREVLDNQYPRYP
jgi:hypothetical protein